LQRVLPAHDSQLTRSVEIVADNGAKWTFYVAASGGQYAGAAFESSSGGYGGPVRVLVGVNSNGTVQAVEILEQRETKGLGARIAEPAFRAQFSGKDIQKTRWRTKRRGGDQITGATVSSDAVAAAVKAGLAVYAKNLATLRRAAPSANGAGKTAKPSE
jgi:electron transport complex protein RnfG